MICPSCYGPSRIAKTLDTGTEVTRIHECMSAECDSIWTTDQKLRPGTLRVNRRAVRRPTATNAISDCRPPPTTVDNPSATANSAGGVGGGLPSALVPVSSLPDPSLQSGSGRSAPARDTIYPAEFELAWNSTAKTGSKFKALESWKRQGRPAADLIAASWAAWSRLDGWQRGFVPHVVTWLNGRCFEQTPSEVRRAGAGPPARSDGNEEALRDWLERNGEATG